MSPNGVGNGGTPEFAPAAPTVAGLSRAVGTSESEQKQETSPQQDAENKANQAAEQARAEAETKTGKALDNTLERKGPEGTMAGLADNTEPSPEDLAAAEETNEPVQAETSDGTTTSTDSTEIAKTPESTDTADSPAATSADPQPTPSEEAAGVPDIVPPATPSSEAESLDSVTVPVLTQPPETPPAANALSAGENEGFAAMQQAQFPDKAPSGPMDAALVDMANAQHPESSTLDTSHGADFSPAPASTVVATADTKDSSLTDPPQPDTTTAETGKVAPAPVDNGGNGGEDDGGKKPSTPETAPDNPSPGAPPPDLRPHPDASQPASYDANIQDSFEQKALAAMDQQQKDQLQKQQEAMAKQVAEARAKGQDTLAQVYEERANKARQLAELEAQKAYAENPANNVDAATKERVLAQHALAKAENDILRANNNERQKEIDDLASEIDKMKAKRNHDIRTLLKEQKLQDLKNDLVVDSLSKLSEQDLAILTKLLQHDVYKDTPWAKEIQRLKSQDATDLKKKLEAESALREINKKLLKKKDATLKSPEQKMDDWAGEIDQAILLGEGPSQDVVDFYLRGNPNKIDPSKLEEKNGADAMVRRIVELKQKLHDQAWERLLIDKPELAKALLPVYDPGAKKDDINDAYKRNQKRMKERAEDAKEAKKSDKEKFGRINKLSLNNAVNQLRYAIRNALRGPKEGRAAARKDAINLLFYIGRRVARKTLLFLLLTNAAFFLVGPIWVAKKLNDWTGGR